MDANRVELGVHAALHVELARTGDHARQASLHFLSSVYLPVSDGGHRFGDY